MSGYESGVCPEQEVEEEKEVDKITIITRF